MSYKIVCLDVHDPKVRELMQSVVPEGFCLELADSYAPEEQMRLARDADFIMAGWAPVPEQMVRAARKVKLIQKSSFQRIWITNTAWLVRDVSVNRANQIWDWVIEHQIAPQLRPEIIDAINEHKENGRRIFILSGTFEPFIERLAIELNLDGYIATPIESKNGLYTGKVEQPLCIGHGKLERLKMFLEGQDGKEIDISKSYFYTDSAADIPVMKEFGHPIAVYPDNELAKIATNNEWEIIKQS